MVSLDYTKVRYGDFPRRQHPRLDGSRLTNSSGLWIVFPAYIIYVTGQDILEGLAVASGDAGSVPSVAKILAIKDE